MEKNIVRHHYKIGVRERRKAHGHNSFLVFFTGLSGSGKSTLANALEEKLFNQGIKTYVLDGDNIRKGINKDLSFAPEDRSENNRRLGEVAKLFVDAGIVVLAAFVAPYRADRELIKTTVGASNYLEVFVNVSLEECERRDVKGLYKKARAGQIADMTGVSSPYEIPVVPDIETNELHSIEASVNMIYNKVKEKLDSQL